VVGAIPHAGGIDCQEVLFDVSPSAEMSELVSVLIDIARSSRCSELVLEYRRLAHLYRLGS
jgi:hypothetical protein